MGALHLFFDGIVEEVVHWAQESENACSLGLPARGGEEIAAGVVAAAVLGEAEEVDVGVVAIVALGGCFEFSSPPLGIRCEDFGRFDY